MAFYTLIPLALQTTPEETGAGTFITLAVVILVVAIAAAVTLRLYANHRTRQATEVDRYLHDPPEGLSFWAMHTLLNPAPTYKAEQHARAIVATLINMGRERTLTIETDGTNNPDTVMLRLNQAETPPNSLEQAIVHTMFPHDQRVCSLTDFADAVQEHLPDLHQKLTEASQHTTFFEPGAVAKRETWRTVGLLTIGLAFFIPLLVFVFVSFARIDLSPVWMALLFLLAPAILLLVGLLVVAVSWFVRTMTPEGMQMAAQCRAFQRHLEEIERIQEQQQVLATWERNLPYAIAASIERPFIIALANSGAHAPPWYILRQRSSSDLRQQMLGDGYVHSLSEVGSSMLNLIQMLVIVFANQPAQVNQPTQRSGVPDSAIPPGSDTTTFDSESDVRDGDRNGSLTPHYVHTSAAQNQSETRTSSVSATSPTIDNIHDTPSASSDD